MEWKKTALTFGAGLLLAALLWASYGLGREAGLREAAKAWKEAPRDTVTVTKTVKAVNPPILAVKPAGVVRIPLPVYAPDSQKYTGNPGDTLTAPADGTAVVEVPIEQRHYGGDEYEAWVSGFRPVLDSIYVFPKVQYITVKQPVPPPSRWSFGLTAGPGVFWGPAGVQPGLGVVAGVQFRF